jgi:aerobic-type carbon monoxide dehydrogenase small subunit (CoxS/CutS family)
MPDIQITINSRQTKSTSQTSVAAAILQAGETAFRTSVSGQPRAALCGMGICYECRVIINGAPHSRSCQIFCAEGMNIVTT